MVFPSCLRRFSIQAVYLRQRIRRRSTPSFLARQLAALKGSHRFSSMCRHQRFEPGDPPAGLENIHLATESIGIILVPPHDRLQ